MQWRKLLVAPRATGTVLLTKKNNNPPQKNWFFSHSDTGIQKISTRGRPFPTPTPLERYENAETPVAEALSEVTQLLSEYVSTQIRHKFIRKWEDIFTPEQLFFCKIML